MTKLHGTEISLLFHASIWEKYHPLDRHVSFADMDENYHGHFSNFFPQRSEKTIFRNGKFKVGKIINRVNRKDRFEKQGVSYFNSKVFKVYRPWSGGYWKRRGGRCWWLRRLLSRGCRNPRGRPDSRLSRAPNARLRSHEPRRTRTGRCRGRCRCKCCESVSF